jgi:hypothetical protein
MHSLQSFIAKGLFHRHAPIPTERFLRVDELALALGRRDTLLWELDPRTGRRLATLSPSPKCLNVNAGLP